MGEGGEPPRAEWVVHSGPRIFSAVALGVGAALLAFTLMCLAGESFVGLRGPIQDAKLRPRSP